MTRLSITTASLAALSVLWIASAYVATPSQADLLFRASTLIVMGISWNLMANAGLISLAHASFFGIGGYVAVIVARSFGFSLLAALPLSIVGGALLGVFLAIATGRLSGLFFAIATLAVSEGLRVIALMVPALTGGAQGLDMPQPLRYSVHVMSVNAALLAAVSAAISLFLSRSKFHYACRAMRSGEGAAQMLGLNPRRYRLQVLAIAGGLASCVGGLSAWYAGFLDPRIAFGLNLTIVAQIGPILGGLYTVAGPVVGALVLTGISEATRVVFNSNEAFGQLLYGAILVVGILLMPQGICGAWSGVRRRYRLSRPGLKLGARSRSSVVQGHATGEES
ncbi:branched-chain amino acid ABC transporter permease [Paraburkholderia aromaticivorans]|uniref:branched-chain amino acid ABC transporter permease n=1 Tax=Paraburkholderia aromaticivorans TaxID=2026199 RepID=UPI0014560666|nr:branched-chain amino acid ABC transporter permease [Paraburkholderia aromaticivorans]